MENSEQPPATKNLMGFVGNAFKKITNQVVPA